MTKAARAAWRSDDLVRLLRGLAFGAIIALAPALTHLEPALLKLRPAWIRTEAPHG